MVSFNLNNSFKKIAAPKGLFIKLILSVLSKKGNWASMLKILNKISLEARQQLVEQFNLTAQYNNNSGGYSNIQKYSNSSKKLVQKFNLSFLRNSAISPIIRRPNLILNFKNKQSTNNNFRINLSLSTLRSIHSLLTPIQVFIELKNKRRGGRVFSVPVPVKSERRRHSIFIH